MKRLHLIFNGRAMYSLTILLLLSCFSISQVLGQNCGWDAHYGEQLKEPGFLKHMQELINRTDQPAKTLNGESDLTEVIIPIVFHIVHKGTMVGSGDNFIYEDVTDAFDRLNSDFSGSGISFCLAERDELGNQLEEPGVVRVDASGNSEYMSSGITIGNPVEYDVKGLGTQFSNYNYCNVWVVSNILGVNVNGQIQGVGYFPNTVSTSIDGMMIRSSIFTNATNRVITHEAGHYLGLFHTFTGDDPDFDGENLVCPTDGDFPFGDGIADTQAHMRSASGSCPSGPNPCPTGGMLEDISNNHMDYSSESCRNNFTAEQISKMLGTVDCHRKGLIHSLGCVPGCDPVITVDYSYLPTNPFANDSDDPINEPGDMVVFSNNSGGTSYEWYVDGVLQTTVNADITVVFETAGDHVVCLVETEGNCTIETCNAIKVLSQGTCQDMSLEPCELLLNGDFIQFNEDDANYNPDGTPFQNQFIEYEPQGINHTDKVCNWVNKGGTPTITVTDTDELVFQLSGFQDGDTNSGNTDIISTIFPLELIHGQKYEVSFQWKARRAQFGTGWGTETILNVGFSNDPMDYNDRNIIHSTEVVPLVISNSADPSGFMDRSFIFSHDENNGNFLCFWGDQIDGSVLNNVKNISVNSCNVCDAEPSFTYENECGSFSFDGVDGNPNSNGIFSWSINGASVPGTNGQEDFDFTFPFEDNFEVCMNITCPYGGTVQFCETVFTGGVTNEGIACESCQNPEVINVSAQRCGEESNEFLVESFAITVPKGFGPCVENFELTQAVNGSVFVNSFYIDESNSSEDIIHLSFTFLADNPNLEMSAIFAVCGPNGETRCFRFVIDNPTTCDTCEDAAQLVTNIQVECDDDNPNDGVQKYSGSYTVNLGTTDVEFCGASSTNSGFSTQMTSVGIDGSFDFDFNICTNQQGTFNVPVTLCFIDNSGKEPKKRCFNFNIAVDEPCPPPSECEFIAVQTPITCVNVKDGVANFLLQSAHSGQSLIEEGYVFCEDNPITGEHIAIPPITGVGITSYLFSVEFAIPCDEVANVGTTTITLNLCHPNGETVCIELQYDLECDECSSCDIVIPPATLNCDNVKDGVANYAFSYAFHSPQLIEQGFVFCEDNPITGDHISIPPTTGIGIAAYLFQVELAMSCEDVANGGNTSITLNLCHPNGETVCVVLELILACEECGTSCDETVSPLNLSCKTVKDGIAEFNISYGYANSSLMEQGFVYCEPIPLSGEYLNGPYLIHITKDEYTFGTTLAVPCNELEGNAETSVIMHLCDENGNSFCVEIPVILACLDCEGDGKGGKIMGSNILESDYMIYPNPSTGNVYIEAPASTLEHLYEIYDVQGKLVHKGRLSNGNNHIDLQNNLNGLYYIQIKNGKNIFQKKIVIID